MTNKKAIKWLKIEASYIEEDVGHGKEILEAYDMAIEALEKEPCEDCISRESVMVRVKEYFDNPSYDEEMLFDDLVNLPSVTPQPKVGEWLKNGELCKCSNCHSNVLFSAVKSYSYCYRCGARMEVSE